MKCPKCGYLGFDSGDRCKNCGYDFSLVGGDAPAPGVLSRPRATPLNIPHTPRPDTARPRPSRASRDGHPSGPDGVLDRPLSRTPESAPLDLPLFDADQAGMGLPPPHRPLGVRRPGSVTPRPRVPHRGQPPVALSLDLDGPAPPGLAAEPVVVRDERTDARRDATVRTPARALPRLAAAFVDLAVIVLVDLVTVYFALRLCGLEPAEWDVLPRVPLISFFLLLNGGYIILLTGTLGQTLGKMAVQIEVVADAAATVGIGRATLRACAAILTLLPAGVGLVWALAGDRRLLHDRVAGTRVIQVSAA